MTLPQLKSIISILRTPIFIVISILLFFVIQNVLGQSFWAQALLVVAVIIGSFDLLRETLQSLLRGKFALDYIALLAITTGLITQQYLVAAVIVLMLSGGNALEEYGMVLAKKSLTLLANRLPNKVQVLEGTRVSEVSIGDVKVDDLIIVRKGEVVALDGVLQSAEGTFDESSLTGEPYPVDREKSEKVRSGVVNVGQAVTLKVTKVDKDSTYRQIIAMVEKAQTEKSPLIRIADRYSTVFTLITITIATAAFLISHDMQRVLAVLVIATPCPLILATPIALLGGMNASARKRIVIKKLSSLEVLSRVKAIILDKTGTITLGRPELKEINVFGKDLDRSKILAIAASIERHSLHPLAKSIIVAAKKEQLAMVTVKNVHEKIGKGVVGDYQGSTYTLSKPVSGQGMAIDFFEGKKKLATFHFEDQTKRNSASVLQKIHAQGMSLHIFTGDTLSRAKKLIQEIGLEKEVELRADCSPEDKQKGIAELKRKGKVTAMIGDGINDAPALASADVGIVFSNQEKTASSEAADVILLGGNMELVAETIRISHRTIRIALQSIVFGIGLSTVGMLFAAVGHIPPLMGAVMQECIDVAVILNALRASRS